MRGAFAAALALGIVMTASAPAAAVSAPPAFHLEQVASAYKRPLYVAAHANPNFLYVVEQRGMIKVLTRTSSEAPWTKAGVFLDLRNKVSGPFIGRGLLGMAFHPKYARNRLFYVFYTRKDADPANNGDIVVAEYKGSSNRRARVKSGRIALVIDHASGFHFGGWMGFGPDGYLYVTTGDAALPQNGYPQDLDSQLAKILRFNPRKTPGAAGIPGDNPFLGIPGDDLVWAYGLRNPWRASFDRATGDLWVADVGQSRFEEINRFSPAAAGGGANLGWPLCEGMHAYPEPESGPSECAALGVVLPLIEYPHGPECSVIGGYVYRGTQAPLGGRYFYGDYCSGAIWNVSADHASNDPVPAPLVTGMHITSFGEDALGELYVTIVNGSIWRIVAD